MNEIINQIITLLNKLKNYPEYQKSDFKGISLDSDKLLLHVDDNTIKLTKSERSILELLLSSKDLFCTYNKICQTIYRQDDNASRRALALIIYRLKKKTKGILEIKTVKNAGYQVFVVKK